MCRRSSASRLSPATGADVRVFPRADHFLIESEHGLNAEDLHSDRYADGAFLALGSWLAAHGLR